jgi:hypothetical protein
MKLFAFIIFVTSLSRPNTRYDDAAADDDDDVSEIFLLLVNGIVLKLFTHAT